MLRALLFSATQTNLPLRLLVAFLLRPLTLQAFTKVTHQEPEHGEAWANLSALWLQEGGWREALHAAEQAVKLKRDSWQTWDNYALAAAQAQAPSSCVRGLAEVRSCWRQQHDAHLHGTEAATDAAKFCAEVCPGD